MEFLAAVGDSPSAAQVGSILGGAIALFGAIWAVVKFLFNRIIAAHQSQVDHLNEAVKREQERAEKSEARADRYEQELKASVKAWFDQVAPAMGAAAHAIDAVTDLLRREDRRI